MPSHLTGPQDKLLTMSFCKVQKQVAHFHYPMAHSKYYQSEREKARTEAEQWKTRLKQDQTPSPRRWDRHQVL